MKEFQVTRARALVSAFFELLQEWVEQWAPAESLPVFRALQRRAPFKMCVVAMWRRVKM